MSKRPPTLPFHPDPEALKVLERLRAAGHEAFFVGGCVRDTLLGRQPKDWDIATSATPDQVEGLFERTVAVGKAFGVILVVRAGREFEVATFRGEGEYSDGRRPDTVHFTTARADVLRRDFTINALLYDPIADKVLDFVGGCADLAAGIVRTVGAPCQRFKEDRLRLLRAVRFAACTGFGLEPATLAAIREMAGLVATVSAERIGEELVRMLAEGYAARSLDLLDETGLLAHVLPEVARLHGVPQPPEFHPEGDVYVHTRLMLEIMDSTMLRSIAAAGQGAAAGGPYHAVTQAAGGGALLCFPQAGDREVLAWAVVLHDIGKPETITYADRIRFNCHDERGAAMAEAVLKRLRRPGWVIEAACDAVGRHMKFCHIEGMREAKRRRMLQEPIFPLHLEVHRLDCAASHGKLDRYQELLAAWREERERPPKPAPLLTGHDLITMGYAPGPLMGKILEAVEDQFLEGKLTTAEFAREWVTAHYPR